MKKTKHCTKLANFYVKWAAEVEAAGDIKTAAEIFEDGFFNEAQPTQTLRDAVW